MRQNLLLSFCLLLTLLAIVFPAEGTLAFIDALKEKHYASSTVDYFAMIGHTSIFSVTSILLMLYYPALFIVASLLITAVIFWNYPPKQKLFKVIAIVMLLLTNGLIVAGSVWPLTGIYLEINGEVVADSIYRIPLNTYFYIFLLIPLLLTFSLQRNRNIK